MIRCGTPQAPIVLYLMPSEAQALLDGEPDKHIESELYYAVEQFDLEVEEASRG